MAEALGMIETKGFVGMVEAAGSFGGRLPELFSGLAQEDFPVPVPYPTACSPQAWSSASAFSFVRTLLRLDPWIPRSTLWLAPAIPEELGDLAVSNVPMAGSRLGILASGDRPQVNGLPSVVQVLAEARAPLHAVHLEDEGPGYQAGGR